MSTELRSLDLLDPRLRPLCNAYLSAANVPGASVTVVAGDRSYHHAFGVKSLSQGGTVTADTSFNIGSCTKAFVSAVLAALVDEGRASWDDPVARFVPEVELYDPWLTKHVSLRDLSGNRVGLPRVGIGEAGSHPALPTEHVLSNLKHTAPAHPFRDRFAYLSYGHVAVALAVGRISGVGFLGALRERILTPLGMNATSGGAAAPSDLKDIATWHCQNENGVVGIDSHFSDQRLGSGGLYVSGRDAAQWLRLHLGEGCVGGVRIIGPDALLETHRPQIIAHPGKDIASLFYPGSHMAAYGLGWGVSDFEGHPLVCHSGVDYGAGAMTILLPKSGIGIAIYGNLQAAGPVPLAFAIAAVLLNLPPRDWRAYFEGLAPQRIQTPAAEILERPQNLDAYAGRYLHPADGELIIEVKDGGLVGVMPSGYRTDFALTFLGDHVFAVKFVNPEWYARGQAEQPRLTFTMRQNHAVAAEFLLGPIGRSFLCET